ncbi:hypothetical protein ACHAWF_011828 [Thalassiosira exigua]
MADETDAAPEAAAAADEGSDDDDGRCHVDLTDLIRRCASDALSPSRPFAPEARRDAAVATAVAARRRRVAGRPTPRGATTPGGGGDGGGGVGDGDGGDEGGGEGGGAGARPGLDLHDAMTALELGDRRMDCCEIISRRDCVGGGIGGGGGGGGGGEEIRGGGDPEGEVEAFPPRIAPRSLDDGTPLPASGDDDGASDRPRTTEASAGTTGGGDRPLLLPSSPCPSLLPYWNSLGLSPPSSASQPSSSSSSSSSSDLLALLLIQLISLEAYVGSSSGGSNAAETLYCALWLHDGVVADMGRRVGIDEMVNKASAGGADAEDDEDDERAAARWILFASSLGTVRLAEAIRRVVVDADVYEEEDFGAALHGEKGDEGAAAEERAAFLTANGVGVGVGVAASGGVSKEGEDDHKGEDETEGDGGAKNVEGRAPSSSLRFCPALRGPRRAEVAWDVALDRLARVRRRRAQSVGGREESDDLAEDPADDPALDALESILRSQQLLFQAVTILSDLTDATVLEHAAVASAKAREASELLAGLEENLAVRKLARRGLVGCDGRLPARERGGRGEGGDDVDDDFTRPLLSASFDPYVNRRLLGNAPVRRARFRSPRDALASLSDLASELDWGACAPLLGEGATLGRALRMLEGNSLRGCGGATPPPRPPPRLDESGDEETEEGDDGHPLGMNVLTRSLVVLNLYFDDKLFGRHDFSEMIGQHMKQTVAAPELLLETTCPDGIPWLTRLAKPMYDALKALCLDRHRERGFTESVLLPAFQLLQYEAATVDELFRREHGLSATTTPGYATNYVILNTIRLMERHVGLGIEMGLYPNWYDLGTALWYRDFLLSALINVRGTVERERAQRREMDLCIQREQEEEEARKHQGKKRGKAKKGKKSKPRAASANPTATPLALTSEGGGATTADEDFEDRLDYTCLLLRRNVCRGLVRYIAALRQAKMLAEPPTSITMFTTHQRRFDERFEAFSTLPQPPRLSYEDYVRGSDFSAVQGKDLLASASDCFRAAKGVVDWLLDAIVSEECDESTIDRNEKRRNDDLYLSIRRAEIMAYAKVCVSNSLFLHKLASSKPGSGSASLAFEAHKQYCTFSIA